MRKVMMIGAATMMLAGMSFGVMAQQPMSPVNCPMAAGAGWSAGGQGMGVKQSWRGGGMRQGGPGAARGMRGGAYMANGLNLTDAQAAQINEIRQQQRLETQAMVREVLTPEQQALFDQRFNANQ
jgi:hypothetical protein